MVIMYLECGIVWVSSRTELFLRRLLSDVNVVIANDVAALWIDPSIG